MEETIKTVTPKELAIRLGISPKRVRMILRTQFPRDVKSKSWAIPLYVAKKVEKAYKVKQEEKEGRN